MILFKKRAYTRICESIRSKNLNALGRLLHSGFDPNFTAEMRSPHALFIAVEGRWLEGVEKLLAAGARCEEHYVIFGEIEKAVSLKWEVGLDRLLLPHSPKSTRGFLYAVERKWAEGIYCFIRKGVTQDQLNLALHKSISVGYLLGTRLLLDEGADPWYQIYCNYSTLSDHYKCTPNEFEYVKLSAIDFAVSIEKLDIVPVLLAHDIDTASSNQSATKEKFQNLLRFAISHGSIIAAKYALGEFGNNISRASIKLIVESIVASIRNAYLQNDGIMDEQVLFQVLRKLKYISNRILRETNEIISYGTEVKLFAKLEPIQYEITALPLLSVSHFTFDGSLRPTEGPRSPQYESSIPINKCIYEIEAFLASFERVTEKICCEWRPCHTGAGETGAAARQDRATGAEE